MDHLFLPVSFLLKRCFLFSTFGVASCLPKKIDDWMMEGLDGGSF